MAQGKNQRLGQAPQAPDVNQLGLKLGDGLAQGVMVALLEFLQLPEPSHERMPVGSIEEQAAMRLLVALFGVQAVVGSQGEHGVAAEPEQFRHRLAAQIVRASVMRWIEIGQNQNFHRPGRDSKPVTKVWRAIPGSREGQAIQSGHTRGLCKFASWRGGHAHPSSIPREETETRTCKPVSSQRILDFSALLNREFGTPFG